MKLEGNAQWIMYVEAGPEIRRASALSVSAKPRTAHFEVFDRSQRLTAPIGVHSSSRLAYMCTQRSLAFPRTLRRC